MATPVTRMQMKQTMFLRDVRPLGQKFAEFWEKVEHAGLLFMGMAGAIAMSPQYAAYADWLLLLGLLYWRWVLKRPFKLPFKIPAYAGEKMRDPQNPAAGTGGAGKCEGILYIGTDEDTGREIWVTNTDARTHMLYLGTTGAGKTEGLKSLVTNALSWASGYVYVDGKADTDLWADLYSVARRFGRDDDVLILNYMTGNSDDGAVSNSMNPFSNGSASYLSNMIVSLMPDAGGDNAMWKERAVALMSALMPALTWKRDKQGLLLDVGVVRDHLELGPIVRLSRDPNMPERIIRGLQGYLSTLPGYVDEAFDDEGNERPPSPDQPMYDLQVARQQHGYLSMQFTRSLQSLADEYGYIFKVQLADIDVLDVVLNRRILVALIPALEKSGDEAANLGKIIAACLKGMMGSTLGSTVEGSWESAIGAKQAKASSSFMTVFDEVGYYTAQGMAVMAAQARSLGFSLVFAAQDIPAMEKRVKQEARSILGNCNIKMFGKIEDPLDTQEFLNKHRGDEWVMEARGMSVPQNSLGSIFSNTAYMDDMAVGGPTARGRVSYDHLRTQREGQVYIFFHQWLLKARLLHIKAPKINALRVHRFLPVPGTTSSTGARERAMHDLTGHLKDAAWVAATAAPDAQNVPEITALAVGFKTARTAGKSPLEAGALAVASLTDLAGKTETPSTKQKTSGGDTMPAKPVPVAATSAMPPATSIPATPSATATQPIESTPLRSGDEHVFTHMENGNGNGHGGAAKTAATDTGLPTRAMGTMGDDLAVVTSGEGVEVSAKDFELSGDVADTVQKSADKLSKGLFGNQSRDDAE